MRGESVRRITRQQFVDRIRDSRRAVLRAEIGSRSWKGITAKEEKPVVKEKPVATPEPEMVEDKHIENVVAEEPVKEEKKTEQQHKKKTTSKNGKKNKSKKDNK